MKFQFKILSCIFTVFAFCSFGTIKSFAYSTITTCAALQDIGKNSAPYYEALNGSYILGSNIDCSASNSWNGGKGFTPIGMGTAGFSGIFNGAGYTISNLYINYSSSTPTATTNLGLGLFGEISNATIINVNLQNPIIKGTGLHAVGALVGADNGTQLSTISNISVSGKLSGGVAGGIIGITYNVNLSQASFIGSIEGLDIGGLVGSVNGINTKINDSSVQAILASNAYATSSLAPAPSAVGGLIGLVAPGPGIVFLTNCYSASSISTPVYPANSPPAKIGPYGGLIGVTLPVIGSFGPEYFPPSISNCFYDNQYGRLEGTPLLSSSDPLGLSTALMKTQSTFTGWDFQKTWGIQAGIDYPYLLHTVSAGVAPVITSQPVSQTLSSPGSINLSITVTSIPNPTVQWQLSTDGGKTFNNYGNPATSTGIELQDGLGFSGTITQYNGYQFRCIVSNGITSVTSNVATITIVTGWNNLIGVVLNPGIMTKTAATGWGNGALFMPCQSQVMDQSRSNPARCRAILILL